MSESAATWRNWVAPGPDHVGQDVRVGLVALGARHRHHLPVPGGLLGVHPEHLVAGRDQRPDPGPAVDLDAHQHLRRISVIGQERGDQFVEAGHPVHPLGQPGRADRPAVFVLHLDVVMVFCPVVSNEQHRSVSALLNGHLSAARGRYQRPNGPVLTQPRGSGHDTPSAVHLPTTGEGTI